MSLSEGPFICRHMHVEGIHKKNLEGNNFHKRGPKPEPGE